MELAAGAKGHVVAFPLPLQGHINPMLILCKNLATQGLSITFVNAQSNHNRLLAHAAAASNVGIHFVPVPDHLDMPIATLDVHRSDNLLLIRKAVSEMRGDFEILLENIIRSNSKVKFILSEMSVDWTQETADKFCIPRVVLFTESAASLSIQYHIPDLIAKKHVPAMEKDLRTIDYLPGFPVITTADIPHSLNAHAEKLDPGFTRRVERIKLLSKASCVLVNSFDALEHKVFAGLQTKFHQPVVPVGPLLPSAFLGIENRNGTNTSTYMPSMWPVDDTCKQWLDQQKVGTVLYVSFGSNATLTFDDFVQLARGLGLSRQPLLWVVRPTLVLGASLDEVVKVVRSNSAYETQSCTVSWAPQLQVLSHAAVGWFVTHCGWNSTLESICAGVPMMCWPLTAEQNLNCKFIVDEWKIGVRLKTANKSCCIRDVIVGAVACEAGSQVKARVKNVKEAALNEAMNNMISKTFFNQ